MKISIYTFVRDGIANDYHVVAMLKHHAQFADELIVNEGYSSDGTYEAICDIDPKIKIIRNHWGKTWDGPKWPCLFKNQAREACTGDWCILLDCDELIPDSEFAKIRSRLEVADKQCFAARITNFYGNYRVFNAKPKKMGWPLQKTIVHPNSSRIKVWGDGANVGEDGIGHSAEEVEAIFELHHFGAVRHPGKLRHLWALQGNAKGRTSILKRLLLKAPWLYELFPHSWNDVDIMGDLKIYTGEVASIVTKNPAEFTRDNMKLYHQLSRRSSAQ